LLARLPDLCEKAARHRMFRRICMGIFAASLPLIFGILLFIYLGRVINQL
jgi:hypothetical protein